MGKLRDALAHRLPSQRFNAMFGTTALSGYSLKVLGPDGRYTSLSTAGLTARVESGDNLGTFISPARVALGGVLLGPVGLVLGAVARKNNTRIGLLIFDGDNLVAVDEGSAKHLAKAERMARLINESSAEASTAA